MDGNALVRDLGRAQLDGVIVDASHAQYDRLRRVNNGLIDRRPAAIIRAKSKHDAQKAVRIAAEREALLAVRCGGHSFPGLSTCDGGIVLDLSLMNEVTVDVEARVATVSGGALLGDMDAASLRHGLVTPAGVISHTGVGGLTLGGGMGWLSRRFGLTIDSLLRAEIVTADSRMLRTSATEEPDLFWAIRGGGGNFGAVTKFWFRLHELGPVFIRGWTYPFAEAGDALRRYRDLLPDAPRELTTLFTVTPTGLKVMTVWSGSSQGAEAALAPFGKLGNATAVPLDDWTFLDLQRRADEAMAWGRRYYSKGGFFERIGDPAIDTIVSTLATAPSPDVELYCLQLGGAVCDVDEDATAYSGRAAGHYWISIGVWDDPARDSEHLGWGRAMAHNLAAHAMRTNYVNEQSDTGVAMSAYGEEKYHRLARLKYRYDPNNLFRLNQNIEPRPWSAPE